jgi:hypothetical protein
MTLSVSAMIFKSRRFWARALGAMVLIAGPSVACVALFKTALFIEIYVPLCYFAHFVFWLSAFMFTATTFGENELLDWIGKGKSMWVTEGQLSAAGSSSSSSSSAAGSSGSDSDDLEWNGKVNKLSNAGNLQQVTADDDFSHFNKDVFKSEKAIADSQVKRMIHLALFSTSLLWFLLLLVSLMNVGLWPQPSASKKTFGSIPCPGWPDPRFSVRRLTCTSRDNIYLSNRYQIYKVASSGMTQVECPVKGPSLSIVDMTVWCNQSDCLPLVLQNSSDGQRSTLVDCRSGAEQQLPGARASFIASYGDGRSLLAVQNGIMVVYELSDKGWIPMYDLPGVTIGKRLAGISVSGDTLLLFEASDDSITEGVVRTPVELYNVRTMQPLGTWRIPSGFSFRAGCGIDDGTAAIGVSSSIDTIDVEAKALTVIEP